MSAAAKLNDREAILTAVVRALLSTQLLGPTHGRSLADFTDRRGDVRTHFAYYRDPVPGDLVVGQTAGLSRWLIGWYVEPIPSERGGGAVIREIGSQALVNFFNEGFVPIEGLRPNELLEGAARRMLDKVMLAFRRAQSYSSVFGGVDLSEPGVAVITVRQRFGFLGVTRPIPYEVRMNYDRRTSGAAVLRALKAAGFPDRGFETRVATEDEILIDGRKCSACAAEASRHFAGLGEHPNPVEHAPDCKWVLAGGITEPAAADGSES